MPQPVWTSLHPESSDSLGLYWGYIEVNIYTYRERERDIGIIGSILALYWGYTGVYIGIIGYTLWLYWDVSQSACCFRWTTHFGGVACLAPKCFVTPEDLNTWVLSLPMKDKKVLTVCDDCAVDAPFLLRL